MISATSAASASSPAAPNVTGGGGGVRSASRTMGGNLPLLGR